MPDFISPRALLGLFLATTALAQSAPAPAITGTPADGNAAVGQTVEWTIRNANGLHYRLKQDNARVIEEGDIAGDARVVRAKITQPGWTYLDVVKNGDKPAAMVASAGVITSPETLKTHAERPADFDSFWQAQVAQVKAVPQNPQVVRVSDKTDGVKLYDVTLGNVDGAKAHAQLARPSADGKYPAIAIFQSAGVYALDKTKVTNLAKQGWLVINVMAHDLPMYEPKAFYDAQSAGPLKNYTNIGNTSRETSYFRKMLLADYQALDYLATRDEWDGKTLIARGESQGGLQTFAMAALHPKVTAMIATFPAGCDTLGPTAAWPYWPRMGPAENRKAIDATSLYYDSAHFAAAVKVPALVTYGLRDVTASPPGVIAAFNALKGPKQLLAVPNAAHIQSHEPSVTEVNRWFDTIKTTGHAPDSAG